MVLVNPGIAGGVNCSKTRPSLQAIFTRILQSVVVGEDSNDNIIWYASEERVGVVREHTVDCFPIYLSSPRRCRCPIGNIFLSPNNEISSVWF